MKITDEYVFFYGGYFSQWHPSKFIDENKIKFSHAEQYMMYYKALLFKDTSTASKILKAKYPDEQKKLGRIVTNFNAKIWSDVCKIVVYKGNKFKFIQNKDLLSHLRDTKGKILVEASPYDKIWGVGLSADNKRILDRKNWKGSNFLGYILTKLRIDIFGE